MAATMHTRASASFLADAAARCADMASKPADQAACDDALAALESGLVASGAIDAPAMVPQQVQQQQANAGAASPALDRAAAFRRADKAWDEALAVAFGRGACDARYSAKGAGAPGSTLRRVYSDRFRAYAAWCEACGMIPGTDPLVEPLAEMAEA